MSFVMQLCNTAYNYIIPIPLILRMSYHILIGKIFSISRILASRVPAELRKSAAKASDFRSKSLCGHSISLYGLTAYRRCLISVIKDGVFPAIACRTAV